MRAGTLTQVRFHSTLLRRLILLVLQGNAHGWHVNFANPQPEFLAMHQARLFPRLGRVND
jgi:hypothetical protein